MPKIKKLLLIRISLKQTGNDLWQAKAKLRKPNASLNFQLAERTAVNYVDARVRCIASLAPAASASENWPTRD
jgi:hypothetical protein